jgi:hypothetical protein
VVTSTLPLIFNLFNFYYETAYLVFVFVCVVAFLWRV